MKTTYSCYRCHKSFERYSSQVRHPDRVFCSKACQASFHNSGKQNPNYKDGNTMNVICHCGNPKDTRARQCSFCSGRGFPIGHIAGDNPLAVDTARKRKLRISYNCESCGLVDWKEKPITLEIHHKDGNRKNNREENLVWLCPNCHSQTENFANRKR